MFLFPQSFHDDLPGLQRRNPDLFPELCSGQLSEESEAASASQAEKINTPRCRKQNRSDKRATDGENNKMVEIGPIMKMTQSVYREIMDDLVEQPFRCEKAGILLGPITEDDLVTHYIPDHKGQATRSSFTLDATGLNEIMQKRKEAGLNCKGVVHVHPPGVLQPSFGDLTYVAKLFANPRNAETTQVLLPIVSQCRLYPYLINAENPREVLVPRLILI